MRRKTTGTTAAVAQWMCAHRLLSDGGSVSLAVAPMEGVSGGGEAADDGASMPIVKGPQQRYRRASDVTGAKEKMTFLRDRSYAKQRPLPALPWRQLRYKTYLDDAERLHGRKETWPNVVKERPESFVRFVAILKDHLRDLLDETRTEAKRARFFKQRCEQRREAYRSYIIAGLSEPSVLRTWARDELERMNRSDHGASTDADNIANQTSAPSDDGGTTMEPNTTARTSASTADGGSGTDDAMEWQRLERRARAEDADLTNSPAMESLDHREARVEGYSAFPFLRRRAIESKESLDPSLADWSAKYFPDDDVGTFAEPAVFQSQAAPPPTDNGHPRASTKGNESPVESGADAERRTTRKANRRGAKPVQRLRRSLTAHLDASQASFDGEGLFFKMKRNNESLDGSAGGDEGRAASPTKAIKPSEWTLRRPDDGRVVRVDWSTVVASRQAKKTPEVHRARERLIRLTRGEDPETL